MPNSQPQNLKPKALINYGIIPTKTDFRKAKLAARNDLRHFSVNVGQRNCGVAPLMPLRVSKVQGRFRHDATVACKNRNSCPWCSTRFMADHRTKINAKGIHALDLGGMCASAVFTLPNRHGHDLKYAYKVLSEQAARFRRFLRVIEGKYGVQGSVRVYEETYGELRGWHPHINYVWFLTLILSSEECLQFANDVRTAWVKAAQNGGIRGTSQSGQWVGFQTTDSQVKQTAQYVTKHSYYVKSKPKLGQNGKYAGIEPWQVLDLARSGDMEWIAVWQGYERGVKGLHRTKYLN